MVRADDVNLRDYFATVRRSWRIVVAFVLVGLLVGLGLSLLTPTKYESSSQVFLAAPRWKIPGSIEGVESSPYQGDAFTQRRARSYVPLIKSRDLALRVINTLGLYTTPEELSDNLSARVIPDTVLIEISARADTAKNAVELTDGLVAELSNAIKVLETPGGTQIPTVEPVVVEEALLPTTPVEPKIDRNVLLGGAGGMLLGLTVALWIGATQRRVGSVQELFSITRRPVLGVIPVADSAAPTVAGHEAFGPAAQSPIASLRMNVEYVLFQHGFSIVLVAAGRTGHGATTASTVLGSALADAGRRVVVVDANLRSKDPSPTASSGNGLVAVLAGERSLESLVQQHGETNPVVITAGEQLDNPTMLFESGRMREVFEQLRSDFDYVIVDCPAVPEYPDALSLAQVVDAVILVAAYSVTTESEMESAVAAFESVNAPLVGSVLNSVPIRDLADGHFYGGVTHQSDASAGRHRTTGTQISGGIHK